MQCENAQELFSDYVAGEMDRALTVSLENHLNACAQCREKVAGLRSVWKTLNEMPVIEPPVLLHANIMERLDAERAKEIESPRRAVWDWRSLFRPRTLAFAATAVIVLLAGTEVFQAQRAELGPLGAILRILHPPASPRPASGLQAQSAEWIPGAQGGVLVLRLHATPAPDGSVNTSSYRVTVSGHTAMVTSGSAEGKDLIVSVPLDSAPAGKTVSITVTPTDRPQEPQSYSVPLSPAPPDTH